MVSISDRNTAIRNSVGSVAHNVDLFGTNWSEIHVAGRDLLCLVSIIITCANNAVVM